MGAHRLGKKKAVLHKEPLEDGDVRVNDWDAHSHPLHQTRNDGEWHISLELEPDRAYRFRYLVNDEEWMDDDHADGYEPNPFGGFDSVVVT
jgi:1,4-alpha-glucan branching enzyme